MKNTTWPQLCSLSLSGILNLGSTTLKRLAGLLIAAGLLSACSSVPTTPPAQPEISGNSEINPTSQSPVRKPAPSYQSPKDYQAIVAELNHWQVQGKLGIKIPDNSGSLYFNWKQEPQRYAIHLSGPLGQGATWIRGNDFEVSIQAGNDPAVYAPTPEALMAKTLGWSLPVDDLYYWTRGLKSPNKAAATEERNNQGQLQLLEQAGWQIQYSRYRSFSGWELPQKMIATRNGIRLTFIIKNWRIY